MRKKPRRLKNWRMLMIILFCILAGCGPTDTGFLSSDETEMEFFYREFELREIPHSIGIDGMVSFGIEYEDDFHRIQEVANRTLSHSESILYKDENVRDYFVQQLKNDGVFYTEESRDDGTWISWYPNSESESEEMRIRVFEFELDKNKVGADAQ